MMPPSGVHPLLGRSERMFARPGYVWAGFHSSAVEVSPSTLFFCRHRQERSREGYSQRDASVYLNN